MPLQDTIHKFTEGSGSRVLTGLLVFFGMVALGVWYDLAAFKNLSTIEGMDNAQLARNLSEGEGYTTKFIRPFSLHLVRQHRADHDPLLSERHPDLANPPLYPGLLALVLKASPFGYPELAGAKEFSRYLPDLWIGLFNQGLFFIAVWMLFRLARRLLDEPAAWVTAGVFAGSDLFWRFSVSGLSTMLLLVLFLGVIEVLSRLEPGAREGSGRSAAWLVAMAMAAGTLCGLAGMTRYSFGFVILPVLAFLAALPTPRRAGMLVGCAAAFLLVMTPWLLRNWMVSGAPFGTGGYAMLQGTALFRGLDLERTLNPEYSLVTGGDLGGELWHKFVAGLREIIEKEAPKLGGSWVSAFFLVGLLVPFRNQTLRKLRGFTLGTLVLFMLVQALARTGLTTESPEVNSENLLAVVAPVVFLFGVSLFFMLVDQFGVKIPSFRLFAMSAFTLVACAPLLFSLLMPVPSPLAYPPYYPPWIQQKSGWVGKKDLIMSDFPWAVAWYGNRQSLWLSLKYREEVAPKYRNDFYALNQLGKPIRALYLSARTLRAVETATLGPWLESGGDKAWDKMVSEWGDFVLVGVFLNREIPTGFPLRESPFRVLPELFLGDSERNSEKAIKGE